MHLSFTCRGGQLIKHTDKGSTVFARGKLIPLPSVEPETPAPKPRGRLKLVK